MPQIITETDKWLANIYTILRTVAAQLTEINGNTSTTTTTTTAP